MTFNAEKIQLLRNSGTSAGNASTPKVAVDVEVVAETGSTNQDVMARVNSLSAPLLLIAERQTAGRGRAGRVWHSAAGEVLTFSLGWRFACSPKHLLGLPLAVGVAVAELLAELGMPVQLKWPNDILKDRKKLAGMLIEITPTKVKDQVNTWAVIGIGLNLRIPDVMEQEIGHSVADAPWLAQMDKNDLMAKLLDALAAALTQFEQQGFAPFAPRWNAHHAYEDQAVVLMEAGKIMQQGIALGVDETGCLLLQTEAGRVSIVAGDVSLRPMAAISC